MGFWGFGSNTLMVLVQLRIAVLIGRRKLAGTKSRFCELLTHCCIKLRIFCTVNFTIPPLRFWTLSPQKQHWHLISCKESVYINGTETEAFKARIRGFVHADIWSARGEHPWARGEGQGGGTGGDFCRRSELTISKIWELTFEILVWAWVGLQSCIAKNLEIHATTRPETQEEMAARRRWWRRDAGRQRLNAWERLNKVCRAPNAANKNEGQLKGGVPGCWNSFCPEAVAVLSNFPLVYISLHRLTLRMVDSSMR